MKDWARSALALLVIGSMPVVAAAQTIDPTAIADEVVNAIAGDTRVATYESAVLDGDRVTITGLSISDEADQTVGEVSEIVVVNPQLRDEVGFIAEEITLIDGNLVVDAVALVWESVTLMDVVVPPEADLAAEAGPEIPLAGGVVRGLILNLSQTGDVAMAGLTIELGEVVEGVPYSVFITIDDVEVPMDLADSQPFSIVREMGFASLIMDLTISGTFDSENDTLLADSVDVAIQDFGHLDISGVFSGLPLGMLQEPGGVEEVLAAAKVESLEARFENGGAMDAFLRVQAELTGVAPEDVAVGLAFVVQAYLQTFDDPDLLRQVGPAVTAFLRDPRTISLVAAPGEPVPLMEIVGLVLSAPTALPSLLELVVTANEAE